MKTVTTVREYDDEGRMVRETITEQDDAGGPPARVNVPQPTLPRAGKFNPSTCPCNPALGGSGICGCIMSGPTITCSTSIDGRAVASSLLKMKRSGAMLGLS